MRRAFAAALVFASAAGLTLSRRTAIGAGAGALLAPVTANAADDEIDVYFGCGCFWHVQHEFVMAEKNLLGRAKPTARAGYAGGKGGAGSGDPCYHNLQRKNDYGSLGHAEVVNLKIPRTSYKDFAREYFKLLGPDGSRPDQFGDRGLEYRNLVGVPGGKESPLVKELLEATLLEGDKVDFARGQGSDADAKALVWVMDTAKYPFFRAENYHQFHDGFARGENYPDSYNDLGDVVKLVDTSCPAF